MENERSAKACSPFRSLLHFIVVTVWRNLYRSMIKKARIKSLPLPRLDGIPTTYLP